MDPIDFVVVGVGNHSLDPVESLRLRDVVALGEGVQKRLEGLPPLSRGTVVETFDSRLALVVVANTEVHLAGLDVFDVLLDSLKTGNSSLLGPSEGDSEPGEGLGRLEGGQLPGSDDTKVGAGTLDSPEEVGVLGSRGGLHTAVSQDDIDALDEVQSKAVHVGAESVTSVKEVTRDTNTRYCQY